MGLFELIFPEREIDLLKSLRKDSEFAMRRSKKNFKRLNTMGSLKKENEQLRNDLGVLTLTLASLISAIKKKGLLTEIEMKEMVNELDLLDHIKDGQLDVNVLRELNKQ